MTIAIVLALVALIAYQQHVLAVQTNRHEGELTRLLARVQTAPSLMLAPDLPPAPSNAPTYVSDEPYHDVLWDAGHAELEDDDA